MPKKPTTPRRARSAGAAPAPAAPASPAAGQATAPPDTAAPQDAVTVPAGEGAATPAGPARGQDAAGGKRTKAPKRAKDGSPAAAAAAAPKAAGRATRAGSGGATGGGRGRRATPAAAPVVVPPAGEPGADEAIMAPSAEVAVPPSDAAVAAESSASAEGAVVSVDAAVPADDAVVGAPADGPASIEPAPPAAPAAAASPHAVDVAPRPLHLADRVLDALVQGTLHDPHAVLGAHLALDEGRLGIVVRALAPHAAQVEVVLADGTVEALAPVRDGLWQRFFPGATHEIDYRVRVTTPDGAVTEQPDCYRFLPTVGELDLHLFNEGRHLRLWERLGARVMDLGGVTGTAFAVWAPNAQGVRLVGDFTDWRADRLPMRMVGASGVWELFVPGVGAGARYKYEVHGPRGMRRLKTDPMARWMEQPPGNAAIVEGPSAYRWGDDAWIAQRAARDPRTEPLLAYEVHLASWARVPDEGDRPLTYREIAQPLAEHVKRLGFTHVELMPVMEHPYGGSWGYQVSGYYAPTSRHGTPDDFRFLVDTLHRHGIGVILDWVPAHFPKDDWALRRFDGTAVYEHDDPRLGDHPEWGTHIFNYGRHEVRNFLLANALYWIEEFHVDGLRVDAVASMLYLDYGREPGQWLRNRFGGRENLEAIAFLRQLNHTVQSLHPGVMTIAEESTTMPGVTHPIREGGLGFTFKWNMGWMHDTLDYFRIDPLFRKGAHDKLTFAMMYEYSERFVNPLSHDEVVHLKRSLLEKQPGDWAQKFANLRTLFGYQVTRPGKVLLFMGSELAPHGEWNHDRSLDWHLLRDPRRQGLIAWLQALSGLYREHPEFWRRDHEPSGFSWIDVEDREQSVLSYVRRDSERHALVVLNLTPVTRPGYRIGAPAAGAYDVALNSDDERFGGSGVAAGTHLATEPEPWHGFPQSLTLTLPPLSCVVLLPDQAAMAEAERARLAAAAAQAHDAAASQADEPAPRPPRPRTRPKRGKGTA